MRQFFFWFIVFLGVFLSGNGLLGLVSGRMWTFLAGGGGPIRTSGMDARICGALYIFFGAVVLFPAREFKALVL